jgi:hypothetical protein
MKKYLIALQFLGLLSISTFANAQFSGSTDELNRLITIKDCAGAEVYARNNFQRPLSYTLIGLVQLDCRGDKRVAADYFKTAALENETIAVEMLLKIGEPLPTQNRSSSNTVTTTQIIQSPQIIQGPPSHTMSTLPQPRQRPTQVIIIAPQPIFNPSACIQDGGGTYCPYYRR